MPPTTKSAHTQKRLSARAERGQRRVFTAQGGTRGLFVPLRDEHVTSSTEEGSGSPHDSAAKSA